MYNGRLAFAILRKLAELFPSPTTSDDLREFQVEGFGAEPGESWLEAIDALLKLGYVKGAELREGPLLANAASLCITADGREELGKTSSRRVLGNQLASESKLVFLSHSAKDQEIAIFLKGVLEQAIPGSDVFVSSDTEDLRPGDEWVAKIRGNLRRAKILLVLASERALSRPWVWYETGAAWSREIRVIPCCLGSVRKNELSAPFSSYQALNADDAGDFRSLLGEIGRELGESVQLPNLDSVVLELRSLDHAGHEGTINALTSEEIQLRVDAANVSAKVAQGYRDAFSVLLTNESPETVIVREIRLIGPKDVALAEPYVLPLESKRTLEPNGRLPVNWGPQSDPALGLIRLSTPGGWPGKEPTIPADLTIEVGCEVLGRFKRCQTNKRVQVDVLNHRIDDLW